MSDVDIDPAQTASRSDSSRAGGTLPSDANRAGGTLPSDANRAGGTLPSDASRAGGTLPSDANRAGGTLPSDPEVDGETTRNRTIATYAAPPERRAVLAMAVTGASTFVKSSDTSKSHIVVRIAPSVDAEKTLAMRPGPCRLNLAVVIDRSGSMEGIPLEQAKRACGAVIDILGQDDLITVVAYAETADLILPARRPLQRPLMRESLGRIRSGSTTNLLKALDLAVRQLLCVKDSRTLNRILLVTDGEPAAGVKEYAAIMSRASALAARGVSVSTFGLGTDYEEDLLSGIAARTGGNYYHVPEPGLLAAALEREVRLAGHTVARNVRMRLSPYRGVNVLRVFGHDAVYGPKAVDLTLSDIEEDTAVQLVCEVEFTQRPAARYRVLDVELLYDDMGTVRPERLSADLTYEFVSEDTDIEQQSTPAIVSAIEIASAIQALDMTLLYIRRQSPDAAEVHGKLRQVEAGLRDKGCDTEADLIGSAISAIDRGVPSAKALMSTVFDLDQGKTS